MRAPTRSARERAVTSAPYPLTQAQVDAGVVSNTAQISGADPAGGPATASATGQALIVAGSALSFTATDTVTDLDGNGIDAGDTIGYSYSVTNTGATTLTDLVINDPKLGLVNLVCLTSGGVTVISLAPGETVTCTSPLNHTLTQAEVDAGSYSTTPVASAQPPGSDPTTTSDDVPRRPP